MNRHHDRADVSSYREGHQAMRRSDDQLVATLTAMAVADPDQRRAAALSRWFDGYAGELRTHHEGEDLVIFPALAASIPAFAAYSGALADDHERLDTVIEGLAAALRRLATPGLPWTATCNDALGIAVELRDLLLDHLALEDDDVLPLIERHLGAEQWAEIDRQALERITVRQALFTVPWFMTTAAPEVAEHTRSNAPLPLRVVWRLTRRRYARLTREAFGGHPTPVPA